MSYEIKVQRIESRPVAAVKFRTTVAEMPHHMGEAFGAVMAYLSRAGVHSSGPAVSRYEMVGEGEFNVAAGFFVSQAVEGDGHVAGRAGGRSRLHDAHRPLRRPAAGLRGDRGVDEAERPRGGRVDDLGRVPDRPETPPEQTRTDIYWPLKPR
jgi:hypothetical protein